MSLAAAEGTSSLAIYHCDSVPPFTRQQHGLPTNTPPYRIGLMIAHGFIVNGAKVYISSRSAGVCDKVAEELTKLGPGKCISIPADLQSLDEVNRLVAEITKRESSKSCLSYSIVQRRGRGRDERSCVHGVKARTKKTCA